jgi:hypothetical protein
MIKKVDKSFPKLYRIPASAFFPEAVNSRNVLAFVISTE